MDPKIEKRVLVTSKYIVENKCSIVTAFEDLKDYFQKEKIPFSQATIHSDIKTRLSSIDELLYDQVIKVIEKNTTLKNNISLPNIVFEHDVNNVSFSSLAKMYGVSKTLVYKKYIEYKETEAYQYNNIKDKNDLEYNSGSSKRENIENQLMIICNYALKNSSTLLELADKFNVSPKELKLALSELLPLINDDMYFVLKDQLGLIDRTIDFGKKR